VLCVEGLPRCGWQVKSQLAEAKYKQLKLPCPCKRVVKRCLAQLLSGGGVLRQCVPSPLAHWE